MAAITFIGAAREVTGSCHLVETDGVRFLVDCGMFQGGRDAAVRNRQPFPFVAQDIDFVLLTHAHIDHCGLLPKLMRDGFRGPIYTTRATADLLTVMLPDSGHIQEYDAKRAAKRRSASRKILMTPLYTIQDALDCLELVTPINYEERREIHPGITCRFRDAGHILGSAIIEIWIDEGDSTRKMVFSGDLGQPGRPILRDPALIEEADVVVMESTYGNRLHKNMPTTLDELVQVVDETLHKQQGNVVVPAFAVGRTQEVIYHLHQLTRQGRLRDLNIFVDSPMATAATRITQQHMALFDKQAKELASWHAAGDGLPNLHFVASAQESMALNQVRSGALIISASGMCDAGRIRHHLRHNLGRRECSVMITGFQAEGTLGRRLVDGADEVTIFGERIPVRAAVHTLGGFSAHADQSALLAWAGAFRRPPDQTFVVHGESSAALAFGERLQSEYDWNVTVPEPGQRVSF